MELFRKKSSDYSDNAYREAVSKLKYLLAESYTPVTVHRGHGTTSPHSTGALYKLNYNAPKYEAGQYSKRGLSIYTPGGDSYRKPTDESDLSSFVKRQENYIQQLEKESQSYREELSKMLIKVKDVMTENQRIREEPRVTLTGSGTEEESEFEEKPGKTQICKHHCSGPNIVYESRISELEAQLTQSRIELRKAQDEATFMRMQVRPLDPSNLPAETNRQIEALQKEKNELNETVSNLQSLISQLRDKEAAANLKVKRSLDLIDQTHFEKNQLELEVRRLKSELDRMNDKQREIMQDSARRVNEAERRYALQIERLNGDLSTQWDTANRLNLELDKAKRTEQELRRELLQKSSVIEELKKELTTKTSNLQTEALTAGAERETLESELAATRLAVERAERNGRAETAKLQAEVSSLRQRLDRADADLLHAKKENLRLSETAETFEKELELLKSSKDPTSVSGRDYPKNDELSAMIKDMDTKHGDGMVSGYDDGTGQYENGGQQNGRVHEGYNGQESYQGQGYDDGSGYPTNEQGYPTDNQGYPADDQSYPTGEQQGYLAENQGYPTDDGQGYPADDGQGYPTDEQAYTTDGQGYPTGTDDPTYQPTDGDQGRYDQGDPRNYAEEVQPTEAYGAPEPSSDVQPVSGVDPDGTSLVAQPEKYIPPPTQ